MMVLDTHVVIWRAIQPDKIPAKVRSAMDKEEDNHSLRVCEISLFEIAMLMEKGRLHIEVSYREMMETIFAANAYQLTGMNFEIAALAVELPDPVNKDPADRIISATALYYKSLLVTADANLRKAGAVQTLW